MRWNKAKMNFFFLQVSFFYGTDELIYKIERVTGVQNNLTVTSGELGRKKLRDWDWQIYAIIYEVDN